ncbi:hypothetical protein NEOLI_000776 [Neolecta irregularis DAH-3]|uniref:Uncharacterized protein n=1 Tax=Neolecta irregularis (strain DAH-3) TaxID=1198029 RepID=A0A1U7LJ02_NEOID|nr:hypothetical protein NEOLI_000776 [Neolecta irregularis DAH-3]|eukprot:OLL22573.1 hypothetical protein NEOLI_000776 [Neolecta irregularis DAH-3]
MGLPVWRSPSPQPAQKSLKSTRNRTIARDRPPASRRSYSTYSEAVRQHVLRPQESSSSTIPQDHRNFYNRTREVQRRLDRLEAFQALGEEGYESDDTRRLAGVLRRGRDNWEALGRTGNAARARRRDGYGYTEGPFARREVINIAPFATAEESSSLLDSVQETFGHPLGRSAARSQGTSRRNTDWISFLNGLGDRDRSPENDGEDERIASRFAQEIEEADFENGPPIPCDFDEEIADGRQMFQHV